MIPSFRKCARRFHEVFARTWHWFTSPVAYALGSPRALVLLHRAYLFETAAELLLMCAQLVLFLLFTLSSAVAASSWDPRRATVALTIVFTLFPFFIIMIRLPAIWALEPRMRVLMDSFRRAEARVDQTMLQALQSEWGVEFRALSGVLAIWYAYCIFWEGIAPNCQELARMSMEALPCDLLSFGSALFLRVNLAVLLSSFMAADAVRRHRENFVPPSRKRIPSDMLDRLPSFAFGAPGTDSSVSDCCICLEAFEVGQKIRSLPCSHKFHSACVDRWLIRTPSCPLRCQNNFWKAMNSAGAKDGCR